MASVSDFLAFWRGENGPAIDPAKKMYDYHYKKHAELDEMERGAYKLARLTKTKTGFMLSVDDVAAHQLYEKMETVKSGIATCEVDISEFIKISRGEFVFENVMRESNALHNRQFNMRKSVAAAIQKGELLASDVAGRESDLITNLKEVDEKVSRLKAITRKYGA